MATIKFKDADGTDLYFYVDGGAGTSIDPYILGSEVIDYDTDGPGVKNTKVVGLALPAAGGAVAGGTDTNPILVSPNSTANNQPATVADGADVALGTTTDAAKTSDADGTAIGFLRGLVAWAYVRMPAALGQTTKANSLPVTFASDSGIGVDQTIGAQYAGTETGPMTIMVRDDVLTTEPNPDADKIPTRGNSRGAQWVDHDGGIADNVSTLYDGKTALTPKFAVINAAISGNNTIVAAVASKVIRVIALSLTVGGAVNTRWESGANGTALSGIHEWGAKGEGYILPYNPVGWFETGSNVLLNLELSGAVNADGHITYVEV